MTKRNIGQVLWLALQCAKDDRQSFIDAYHGDTSEEAVRQALADVRAFERVQIRLFGTTRSELQTMMSKLTPVSILKIMAEGVEDAQHRVEPTASQDVPPSRKITVQDELSTEI